MLFGRYDLTRHKDREAYAGDQDLDSPLIRSAQPVLERLGDQLEGQPISMILTDQSGVVLTQRPVGLERIGEKRRVDPLYVEIFGKRTRALA